MTSMMSSTTTLLALRRAPSQAIATLLALLDRSHLDGAILLVGKSVDKAALAREFAQRSAHAALRTPQGRFVFSAALDAAALPTSLRPWQHLIYVVLDIIRRRSGPNATLDALRKQFDDVLRLEQRNDASAEFALAAFVHQFRTHFGTLLEELPESVLALVIYHLDKADPEDAQELVEAAQYFLNTPRCAIIYPVDEERLTPTLRHHLLQWAAAQLSLEEDATAPSSAPLDPPSAQEAHSPLPTLRDLPESCARVLIDALQPDAEAIARAAARWRVAMRTLSAQAADGGMSPASAVHVARLCALHEMLPPVFSAALQQPTLLHHLERSARAPRATASSDEWAHTVMSHPRAKMLFMPSSSSAAFSLLSEAALRAALHAIAGTGEHRNTPTQQSPARSSAPEAHAAKPAWLLALNERSVLLVPTAFVFALDRLIKAATLSSGAWIDGLLSTPAWAPTDVWLNVLGLTLVLLGLALGTLLVLVFNAHRRNAVAKFAYALLLGSLSALLADLLLFGTPLNVVHLPGLPRFSPAHALAALGAVLLATSALLGEQTKPNRR